MNIKNIVITGANSGIGLATSIKYLEQGHHVYAISRNVEILASLLIHFPDTLHIFKCDISDANSLDNFYSSMVNSNQSIDVLIANAGIAKAEPLINVTVDSFDATFNINVKGLFFTVQKAISLLTDNSSIVLVGSIQANKGAGTWAIYGASKAAVRSLTRSFAEELGDRGIRVNCISPGVTQTPIFSKFGFDKDTLDTILKTVSSATPLNRLGTPEEIADAIQFLCSESASFISGADLQVDGGLAQI
jgi:NAD(P)-dependent dehydrogenase (short-subunit alcohol dehydrogenase family)